MPSPRTDSSKTSSESRLQEKNGAPGGEEKKQAGASGFHAWLPLFASILVMPALAYATTQFYLLPKLQKTLGLPSNAAPHPAAEKAAGPGATSREAGQPKVLVPLGGKVLVNLAGTMGTRYLLANVILVGTSPDFKSAVEKNDAQLRDAASSALSAKTISDLEKSGARNLIRAELVSLFNGVLGEGTVAEIYLTEFAIQ